MPGSFLARLLALRAERADEFVGEAPAGLVADRRVFGGALLAMAVRAASCTVPDDRVPHSMHHVFTSAARGGVGVRLRVVRSRDGRTFSTRLVQLWQDGQLRGTATLSFAVPEPGRDAPMPMRPRVPPPHPMSGRKPVLAGLAFAAPFELYELDPGEIDGGGPHDTTRLFWARLAEPVPADCLPSALAYLSDFGATIAARAAVGADRGTAGQFASLNHTIWWHRSFAVDDWLLVDFRPVNAASARGLVAASVHTRSGAHVATVMQEALMRLGSA